MMQWATDNILRLRAAALCSCTSAATHERSVYETKKASKSLLYKLSILAC